jgi:Flp pilus assembly protein TadG
MRITRGRLDSERGAVLLHVAIGILVMIGLLTFVVDWGVMWVARNQAQNSADAGALAGAISMAFDANGWTDRAVTGPARQSAQQVALTNTVFAVAPDVVMATDVIFTDQPADMCPVDVNGLTPRRCVSQPGAQQCAAVDLRPGVRDHRSRRPSDGNCAGGYRRYHQLHEALGDSRQVD